MHVDCSRSLICHQPAVVGGVSAQQSLTQLPDVAGLPHRLPLRWQLYAAAVVGEQAKSGVTIVTPPTHTHTRAPSLRSSCQIQLPEPADKRAEDP